MIVMCVPISTAVASSNAELDKIEFSATVNKEFTDTVVSNVSSISNSKAKVRDYLITDISCSIDVQSVSEQVSGTLVIKVNDENIAVNVAGTVDFFEEVSGYVGVFDGTATIDGVVEQITVDMLYRNESNNFTALTIGCAGDVIPQIVFLGEFTDTISKLSSLNVEKTILDHSVDLMVDDDAEAMSASLAIDATTRYQSTKTESTSGYEMVTISLYYANELRNQSSMSVYAKVNSHTASFRNYLINVQGYDVSASSLVVYPDSYMVEIVEADKYLHSDGTIDPKAGSTSQNLTIPAYLPVIGFFTIGVPITMTSTTVAYRGVATGAIYPNNIITWNVYKRYGWNASTLDGYYDDAAGGLVYAGYKYEGDVTSDIKTAMGAYGQVRYEYVYSSFSGSSMTLHMWTTTALCSGSLTIVP